MIKTKQSKSEMPGELKEFLGGLGYKAGKQNKTPAEIAWDRYKNYNGKDQGERLRLMNEALKLKFEEIKK